MKARITQINNIPLKINKLLLINDKGSNIASNIVLVNSNRDTRSPVYNPEFPILLILPIALNFGVECLEISNIFLLLF